ncbi:antitoxin Xre/MbcA/ParS toxin-binding domain-containing protein [Phreatobacter aquaticus]|uniref:antitoxin Xre/MbcA/ParS toxin-binding domain-containing protein n=1 Tax=Phreatobacter aquaticus TaxID=2570229 RepID=UPI00208FB6BB|nr:antitoxin Xre/MbcA/ParS toxin-binding domain-containing protein [Phreatobacter aquaticus]
MTVGPRGTVRTASYFGKDGLVVIERVADRFGVSKAQLADTMGVKPETFHRTARANAPKTQGRVTEMVEIVARVSDWAGGEKQALAWYRAEPLPAFGGRTAESLVKDGKAGPLRDWLDHVATGGFA